MICGSAEADFFGFFSRGRVHREAVSLPTRSTSPSLNVFFAGRVAMTALTYAGLMTAGPFFVSRKDLGLGSPSLVLDMDKMGCYVAEKVGLKNLEKMPLSWFGIFLWRYIDCLIG